MEITQAQGQSEGETEGVLQPIYMKDEWGAGQAGWRSGGGVDRDCDLLSACVCVCVCCVLVVCDLAAFVMEIARPA